MCFAWFGLNLQVTVNGKAGNEGTVISKTEAGNHNMIDEQKVNGTVPSNPSDEKKVSKPKDYIGKSNAINSLPFPGRHFFSHFYA